MEYYNKIVCVTVHDLTNEENGEAIMKLSNYKQLVSRNRITVVRKAGGLGVYALIDYNSLPERFRIRFENKYGDPVEILKENCMSDRLILDDVARSFYSAHVLPDGQHLPSEKIEEYTINASVLNELIKLYNDRVALKRALGGKAGNVWVTIIGTAERFRSYPGHTLPESSARLKQKIKEYKETGYECLISRKFCNDNTLKITPEAGRWIVAKKRSRVPVYNNQQIFEEFNKVAPAKGWKLLKTVKSLVQYLDRPEVEPLWWDAVYGELSAKQRYGRKHQTELPQLPNALWYGDGTKLNLYYKAYNENGKLEVRTTQVYEVMDAATECLLGYHISDSENFNSQYRAYRMAVETAQCKPFEIVSDNQGGHKKLEAVRLFEKICRVSRRTAPYNAPSKTIESAFGRFQAQILHKDWRFTGQNITAKSQKSRPNLEFIEANKESLYTLEELKQAYLIARNEWNLSAHPATDRPRLEMYQSIVNPEAVPVDQLDMVEMFWVQRQQPATFTSSGITIEINKQKYKYEVLGKDGMPDMEFRRKNTLRTFVVMYDPLDLTQIRLYTEDKNGLRYVATASPYIKIHRAIQEQKPGEMEFIRHQEQVDKEIRISHQIDMAILENDHGVAPEQHGLNRPAIKGISAKAVEAFMTKTITINKSKEEPVSIGVVEKAISNYTYDQASVYDKL